MVSQVVSDTARRLLRAADRPLGVSIHVAAGIDPSLQEIETAVRSGWLKFTATNALRLTSEGLAVLEAPEVKETLSLQEFREQRRRVR